MKITQLLFAFLIIGSLGLKAQGNYNDFIPVGPAPIDFKIFDGRLFSELSFDEANNPKVINLLPNEIMTKSIIMIDKDGNMEFSPIELSQKGYTYVVRTDYIKYTTLPVKAGSTNGEVVGIARVGVGVRCEATIKTMKKDINVTDLFRLGVSVGPKSLQGNLTMSIMGIESEEITNPFPVNAEISPTSVAATLQVMAITKHAIYDKDSHLTPQVLQIKYTEEFMEATKAVQGLSMPIILNNDGSGCVVIRANK